MSNRVAPLFALIALAMACARKPVVIDGTAPVRDVRVLGKGDLALRRISFAAAGYLKSISNSPEIGFRGVYHKRELDIELTRDIVTAMAFVDVSNGSDAADANGCVAVPTRTRATPTRAPRDPSTGATGVAAAAPTTDNRGCANSVRATYGFNKFRVAADSAYVETTGLNQGLTCMVLAVNMEVGGWKVVTVKPTRPEACGK